MLRDLTTDLIINERIETTEARAKELRSVVEKMITLGKRGDLHARRQAAAYIRSEVATSTDEEGMNQQYLHYKNYLMMLHHVMQTSRWLYSYYETWTSSRRRCTNGNY